MTGEELKAIRRELGLTVREFGLALGYTGSPNTLSVQVRELERGTKPILPWLADRANALLKDSGSK